MREMAEIIETIPGVKGDDGEQNKVAGATLLGITEHKKGGMGHLPKSILFLQHK